MKKRTLPKVEITTTNNNKGDCRNCQHASPVENYMVDCYFFAPAKVAVGIHYCIHYKSK